jgi:putative transposase
MPQLCPAEFVNVIKTKTARFARRDYPEQVSRYYWKRLFWSDSYFIATVSERSMSAVKEYINNQQG